MATAASLSVRLTLDSGAFNSEVTESYANAGRASNSFKNKAKSNAEELAAALKRTSEAAKNLSAVNSGEAFSGIVRGGGRLNYVLHEVAAGSNVAGSTIINALLPALDTLKKQLAGGAGGWKEQREAAEAAAKGLAEAAQKQIELAAAEKERALAEEAIAKKTIAAAAAQREQAIALDEYYANRARVNAQYGITVSYQDEHLKNERAILEAERMEAAALEKLAAAQEIAVAADEAEIAGKESLAVATEAATAATVELSLAQRAAATGSQMLKTALGMLGGVPGLVLTGIAAAGMAIYSRMKDAEAQTKKFNAALMSGKAAAGQTVSGLQSLNSQLGASEASATAVAEAVKAGFSGDMLNSVAAVGAELEDLGGSASEFISELSKLSGDPVQAMRELTAQGVLLDKEFMQHIITLKTQGKTAQATSELQQKAIEDEKEKIKANTEEVKHQGDEIQGLALKWGAVSVAMGEAGMVQQQTAQIHKAAKQREEDNKKQKDQGEDIKKQLQEQNDLISAQVNFGSYFDAGVPKAQQLANEIKKIRADGEKLGKSQTEIAQAVAGVEARYATVNKHSSTHISQGERLLQQARQRNAELRAEADQNEKLTNSELALTKFNQQIAELKGKNLSADQQSLVANQDAIRSQLQQNAALERAAALKKLSAQYDQQAKAWAAETAALRNENASTGDKSDQEIEQQQKIEEVQNRFRNRRLQLDKAVTDQQSAEYQKQLALLDANEQEQIKIVENAYAAKTAKLSDYTNGFSAGAKNWANSAGDAYSLMKDFASQEFGNMADSLANFATTGKMNFKSFTRDILADLSKIAMQIAMSQALQSIFGSFGGSAAGAFSSTGVNNGINGVPTPPKLNAKGGTYTSAGLSAYSNTIVSRPTMFAFAKGAGLMGEAGPEAIMPLTRAADGSLGVRATGGNATVITVSAPVTIQSSGNGGGMGDISARNTADTSRQLKAIVETTISERLRREVAPGGLLYSR